MCDSQVIGCQMPVRLPERKAHSTFAQLNPLATCEMSVTKPISSKLTKSCPITGPKVASVARPKSPQIKTVRRAFFVRFIDAEQHRESPPSVQPASGSAGWLLRDDGVEQAVDELQLIGLPPPCDDVDVRRESESLAADRAGHLGRIDQHPLQGDTAIGVRLVENRPSLAPGIGRRAPQRHPGQLDGCAGAGGVR